MDSKYFSQIIGEKLSAVVFVLDYHQLQIDGPSLTILNPITVASDGSSVAVGEDQFRNRLCEQIAKIVRRADCKEGDALVVEFEDDWTISVSLKNEDYNVPEAVIFRGHNALCVVI